MSHHHHHPAPTPTLAEFLTPMVGEPVALLRHQLPKVSGTLTAVLVDGLNGTPDNPGLLLSDHLTAIPLDTVERVKLHFNPDRKDRR